MINDVTRRNYILTYMDFALKLMNIKLLLHDMHFPKILSIVCKIFGFSLSVTGTICLGKLVG